MPDPNEIRSSRIMNQIDYRRRYAAQKAAGKVQENPKPGSPAPQPVARPRRGKAGEGRSLAEQMGMKIGKSAAAKRKAVAAAAKKAAKSASESVAAQKRQALNQGGPNLAEQFGVDKVEKPKATAQAAKEAAKPASDSVAAQKRQRAAPGEANLAQQLSTQPPPPGEPTVVTPDEPAVVTPDEPTVVSPDEPTGPLAAPLKQIVPPPEDTEAPAPAPDSTEGAPDKPDEGGGLFEGME
jgi:hypothetical protein